MSCRRRLPKHNEIAVFILYRLIILMLFSTIYNGLEAVNESSLNLKPQNDVGFVVGFGIQSNGNLQNRLQDHYASEGWGGGNTPSYWVAMDCGFQFRTIKYLYITPGLKTLYSSVKKTIVWEDIGYSQDDSDLNVVLMPSMAMKYIIYHKGLHSITVNGMLSKPNWVFGPEEGFSVKSDGYEKGAFIGYEIGNPINSKKRTGYAKAIDRSSRHIVIEAGLTSIPVRINSEKCDIGGIFVNLKAYFGFKDWN